MKLGPYRMLEKLGEGGMGTVYRCVDESTGQNYAVKLLAKGVVAHPILRRRFQQECAAAVRLRHPHLVRGIEFRLDTAQPYLVMELVEGMNLCQQVLMDGVVPPRSCVRYGIQLAGALGLAHENRILHRDVKPENVLVTPSGDVKLTDLGLSKDLDAKEVLTRPGSWIGTIAYMAPEQFGDSLEADARCDIYGLGATLYYALTGTCPFPDRGNMTVLGKKLRNQFTRPVELVPTIPADLDQLICEALQSDAAKRPESMEQLRERLTQVERMLDGKPSEVEVTESGNRRASKRFPARFPAQCRLVGGKDHWPAQLQEISTTGLRMEVTRRYEPGTLLSVAVIQDPALEGTNWLARVCWVKSSVIHRWILGCEFTEPLHDGELVTLLGNKDPTVILHPRRNPTTGGS